MRDDVRDELAAGVGASLEHRTIDITTTGRRSGLPRRIEIVFYRYGDDIYLSGVPAPRTRDWLANLTAEPRFTFHLKGRVIADLPAVATIVTDATERRGVMTKFVAEFNERHGPGSPWPRAVLEEWVAASPLARVDFTDAPAASAR